MGANCRIMSPFLKLINKTFSLLIDIFALTRPRLSILVMTTVFVGILASKEEMDFRIICLSLFLIYLSVASGTILNCYMERDSDKLMERTKTRPLPAARLHPTIALILGLFLGIISLVALYIFINSLTAYLAGTAIFFYLFLYTPLKSKTSFAVWVGAVSGAIPPLMGFAAITGSLNIQAYSLFLILFFWQIPHFLAISLFRREDYKNASIIVYPNTIGLSRTRLIIVISSILLLVISTVPSLLGETSFDFLVISILINLILVGAACLGFTIEKSVHSQNAWAKRVFFTSLVHQPLLLGAFLVFA